MAFIGIIAESKFEMQMKRILDNKLNAKTKKHTIIIINDKSIENIKNITLDEIKKGKDIISELLKNTKYLILNSDADIKDLRIINDIELKVITFGFNQKSTITASSVEENLMVALQRKIIGPNKNALEPQEIEVKIINKKLLNHTHNSMGIASILLIYGEKEIFF